MLWVLAIGGVFLLFTGLNRLTARTHARFSIQDVEEALENLLSPEDRDRDTWELFLCWPIKDPYLESVRHRCLRIDGACGLGAPGENTDEAKRKVAAVLEELRGRISVDPE